MEGKINFTGSEKQDGKRPCFKGYLTIGEEVHEFAVWPAKTGNGWSGTYKPKEERAAYKKAEPKPASNPQDDSEIPF